MKLALFDTNQDYIRHFSHTVKTLFEEQITLLCAGTVEEAKALLRKEKPDLVLVDSKFAWISVKDCLKLYITEEAKNERIKGLPAIHKFQKFPTLIEQAQKLLADYRNNPQNYTQEGKKADLVAFASAAGGSGKSTLAMAYARRQATQGEDVLFLSLENFSSLPMVFHCDGEKALHMALEDVTASDYKDKVEELIQRESKGVYYIEPAAVPMQDNISTVEKVKYLLRAFRDMDSFDKIVVELADPCLMLSMEIFGAASEIMLVTEENDVAFFKTEKLIHTCIREDEARQEKWLDKMALLVNKARMNIPVSDVMKRVKKKYQIGDCGQYRMAKAVELLTPQMQMLENIG